MYPLCVIMSSVFPCHSCVIGSFACPWVRVGSCLLFQWILSVSTHQSILFQHWLHVCHILWLWLTLCCHRMCVPRFYSIQHVNKWILDMLEFLPCWVAKIWVSSHWIRVGSGRLSWYNVCLNLSHCVWMAPVCFHAWVVIVCSCEQACFSGQNVSHCV